MTGQSLLSTLDVSHEWEGVGGVLGLRLEPDAETRSRLRRHGLTLHRRGETLSLLGPGGVPAATLAAALAKASDDAPLCFRLAGNAEHLAEVTELPPGTVGLPNYSSRNHLVDGEGGDGVRVLQPEAGEGSACGMVRLHPADLGQPPLRWRIGLQAKALPWAYYLINRSQIRLEAPLMRNGAGLCLQGPVPVSLPGGEAALRFESGDGRLSLRADSGAQFGLYDRVRSQLSETPMEVCIIRRLPVPAPSSLEWGGEGSGRRPRAAAYVYL